MKKVILFGAGEFAKKWIRSCKSGTQIVAIADNNFERIETCEGHLVIDPRTIIEYEFDELIIALDDQKKGHDVEILSIYKQLIKLGVNDKKIFLQSLKYRLETNFHKPRTEYIYCLADYFNSIGLKGAIAECGVYRGWFSAILSEAFENSTLYLFDSFDGFLFTDLELESSRAKNWVNSGAQKRLSNTSEEIVKLRIRNRERLDIRKGFVPKTLENVNDQFLFVNLDMDLYTPQFEALKWFAPRMVVGGVILMHDYYNDDLPGTKMAIDDFDGKDNFAIMPIGDMRSMALIRK